MVPLIDNHFSVYIGQGIVQIVVLRLLRVYDVINPYHELIVSILDKTRLSVDEEHSITAYCKSLSPPLT
jgi:hypothetical protein